tara:strand:+ start:165 stop:500 length:336 start_codon:yes stop_codon:yes gene_type:complete
MEWLNEEGEMTTYSFMIYSYFGIRDNAIINHALTQELIAQGMATDRYVQNVYDVDEEKANKFNMKRGLNVQWVFSRDMNQKERDMIVNLLTDGLNHLNIAHDLYGVFGYVD